MTKPNLKINEGSIKAFSLIAIQKKANLTQEWFNKLKSRSNSSPPKGAEVAKAHQYMLLEAIQYVLRLYGNEWIDQLKKTCKDCKKEKDGKPGFLGWANGWVKNPEIVEECRKSSHAVDNFTIRNHINITLCGRCGYWYKYDDS